MHTALSRMTVAALAVLTATCSPPTKPGPIVGELAIQSVSPAAGPATGGTELTIRGTGFGAGTTVTIGGRAATDVVVRSADMLTAKTPASPIAGAVDIAVLLNGKTGTLSGGFRYNPNAPNTAPVLKSITAQGKRLRQPANFADYGETIVLTAVVEDLQTAPALLLYQWLTCGGTIVGTGATVEWQIPPSGGLPLTCTVELVVSDGLRVATGTVPVRLHNSATEVAALALEFLEEFANSTIPAETTVRNFSQAACAAGRAAELSDVTRNRNEVIINSHIYGTPATTIAFGGSCKSRPADACVITAVEWNSTVKLTGAIDISKGTSFISGVYRDSRWWLCESLYDGKSSLGLQFMR